MMNWSTKEAIDKIFESAYALEATIDSRGCEDDEELRVRRYEFEDLKDILRKATGNRHEYDFMKMEMNRTW